MGWVRFGSLRRVTPISRSFGFERGSPVDRYPIDAFLGDHAAGPGAVRGRVLEIGEDRYATRFAVPNGLDHVDILDPSPDDPRATVIVDLTDASQIPSMVTTASSAPRRCF